MQNSPVTVFCTPCTMARARINSAEPLGEECTNPPHRRSGHIWTLAGNLKEFARICLEKMSLLTFAIHIMYVDRLRRKVGIGQPGEATYLRAERYRAPGRSLPLR